MSDHHAEPPQGHELDLDDASLRLRVEEFVARLADLDERVEDLSRVVRRLLWRAIGCVALRTVALSLALWLLVGLVLCATAHG